MGNFSNNIKRDFSIIPNKLILETSLSDRARFLFVWMASKPDNWEFYNANMCKELGYSLDTLRKYIKELCSAGWLSVCEQNRHSGKFGNRIYVLHSEPVRKGKKNEATTVEEKPLTPDDAHYITSNIYNIDYNRIDTNKKEKYIDGKNLKTNGSTNESSTRTTDETTTIEPKSKNSALLSEISTSNLLEIPEHHLGGESVLNPNKGVSESNVWVDDFDEYYKMARNAVIELSRDTEWIKAQKEVNPNINILLSLKKAFLNFWGTEEGWQNKRERQKKSRPKYAINWKLTYAQSISMHKVYIPFAERNNNDSNNNTSTKCVIDV
jgi:hypothetical protein